MLEIVIASIVLLAAFIGVAWYGLRRSKQSRDEMLSELDERMSVEVTDTFTAVLEKEMTQQFSESQTPDIDSEPVITLSEQAQQIEIEKPILNTNTRKNSIDITIDDSDKELVESHKPTVIDWDMVVAFTIVASEGQQFSGLDLKVAFEKLHFEFGELDIYHRMATGVRNTPLFSIANVHNAGTFKPQDATSMATSGILLFAKLPGPVNGLTLFDDLLETAQSLTNILAGTLCDENRKPVNQNTFERMRNRILELNLSIQSEQRQYGTNDYSS